MIVFFIKHNQIYTMISTVRISLDLDYDWTGANAPIHIHLINE